MNRLPPSLSLSLVTVTGVALAILARSVLFERWTTVVVAVVLLLGANAALRARTWGVGVLLATAFAFPGAAALGFAPMWFWLVGLVAALPFVLVVRSLIRFDAAATGLFALLATSAGVVAAFAWREAAFAIFFALHGLR